MGLLKPASNKMAYAKIGIYGSAGSGKTLTAALIAIGLHKKINSKKPVVMFDTEPGASFLIPKFKAAGIDFQVADESRAFKDLMAFMDEAEKVSDIVIIDSISHVWRDLQDSYLRKLNDARGKGKKLTSLEFGHWNKIKSTWAEFTDRYLSSKMHVIVCGRAGSVYEYQYNEEKGKKELITTGTKMAVEKELGHEPSLLIEMVAERDGKRIINRAFVEKDRADLLNGKIIDFPTYEAFAPHFDFLNIGGEHFQSSRGKDSSEMFDADGNDAWRQEQRRREVQLEEINNLLTKYELDGRSDKVKKERIELLERVFGTASKTALENFNADKLLAGHKTLVDILNKEKTNAD
jgi:hypothetical protein